MGWVEALAISDGGVLAHGRLADLEGLVGPGTSRLALGPEEAAIPALADAHLHLLDAALADERVDISGLSPDQTLDRIGEAHTASRDPDAWLEGEGWDPDGWGIWPDAGDLERVAPGRLAAFWAHDRHSLWVSERALAEAAITADRGPERRHDPAARRRYAERRPARDGGGPHPRPDPGAVGGAPARSCRAALAPPRRRTSATRPGVSSAARESPSPA
jgi:predicted amidohydrolase YtcJ